MSVQYGHLRVVDPSYPKSGARRFEPPPKTESPRLSCLMGAKLAPWRALEPEARVVDVKVTLDAGAESARYRAELSQSGFTIDFLVFAKRDRAHLTCWFEPGDGPLVRVPWAAIDRGETWCGQVRLRDFFFELRAERKYRQLVKEENSKIMSATRAAKLATKLLS